MEDDMAITTHEQHADTRPEVEQIVVPASAPRLSTLARIDYVDAFRIHGIPSRQRTGEQWARAVMEDTPGAVKARLLSGWLALGLKLGSPWSRARVLGWRVRVGDPDFALLGAGGRIGLSGELLFQREPDGLLFATFVRQRNPVARAIWARVEATHQEVVRSLLGHAARRAA
jgi:hypothetical protein